MAKKSLRHLIWAAALAALLPMVTSGPAAARDTRYELSIADVLKHPDFKDRVPQNVTFYFANQGHPDVAEDLGEFVSNRKTNSVGKADEQACLWGMLSALKSLAERAVEQGGNAVINVVSYYKKNTFASESLYECHAGNVVAGVALKGTIVKLKN